MKKKKNTKIKLTLDDLKSLMTFHPTLEETACWFDCSTDTIERRVSDLSGMTFKEFRLLYSGKTRLLLKRKAITKALEEDDIKLLVYCLKAMTDMRDDNQEQETIEQGTVIKLAYTLPKPVKTPQH